MDPGRWATLTKDENNSKPNKYQEIVNSLRGAIESGVYGEGARLPSELDLVKQTGASRPTVSRALRELQAVGLIRRRVGSGSYVLKPAAPAQHKLFGLLIPRLGETEIFESISRQISREAEKANNSLIWGDISQTTDRNLVAERTCEPYVRQKVAGVFFAPLELSAGKDEVNHKIAALLSEADIPIVLLDRDLAPYPSRSRFDLVGIDNFAAGYMLAEHLVKRGSRRFLFVAHPMSAETVSHRITGAYAALVAAGIAPSQDFVQLFDVGDREQVEARIRKHSPDAVICANDKTAAELMQSLGGLQVRVPQQVRVVGIDDVRYAKLLNPGLTTVHQPCEAIGEVAMQVMLERLKSPEGPAKHITLPISLIERDSSR